MIKYEIELSGIHQDGLKFLQDLAKFSKMQAEPTKLTLWRNRFPHRAFLYLETEEVLKDEHGVKVNRMDAPYTKAELEEMGWAEFKTMLREEHGITGRDRNVLINKYLALFN